MTFTLKMSENRFCFIAIVRDEAPVIERCLSNIKNLATSYLICDTGSVDDTIQIITNYMLNAGIPGEVITHPWKSYGYNKSYLLEKLREHPIASTCKYIAFHDADEVFITDPNDWLSYPTKEDADKLFQECESHSESIFMLKTIYGGTRYNRWQIMRNNQKYHWEMPFQEYLVGEKDNSSHFVNWIYNLARKEGNSSRDPKRDHKGIQMLIDYLEEKPDEPRAVFYLAQTYKDVGKNEEAIIWYQKRMTLTGFYEERYLSGLYAARMTKDQDKKREWLEYAISVNANRLEAYYDLMMIDYSKGDHPKAFATGSRAPENCPPGMFSEDMILRFLFDINYSVSCYYSGNYEKAFQVGLRLLARSNLTEKEREQAAANMKFFSQKINTAQPRALVTSENADKILNRAPKNDLPTVMIIDNFYDNPDDVRKFALAQDYGVRGNYPGGRTKTFAAPEDKARFEKILQRKITYFPAGYNGSFQIVTADLSSWIHRDNTDFSALVFLTPNPGEHSGTLLYRHRATNLERTSNDEEEKRLNLDSRNAEAWEIIDRIGNKYNRCVIFQGRHCHKSDQYFGTDHQTGRLFQAFFFNVEGY